MEAILMKPFLKCFRSSLNSGKILYFPTYYKKCALNRVHIFYVVFNYTLKNFFIMLPKNLGSLITIIFI